jgi:hypothetical protein
MTRWDELAAEYDDEADAAEEWEQRFLRTFQRDDLTDLERAHVAVEISRTGSRAREYRERAEQARRRR